MRLNQCFNGLLTILLNVTLLVACGGGDRAAVNQGSTGSASFAGFTSTMPPAHGNEAPLTQPASSTTAAAAKSVQTPSSAAPKALSTTPQNGFWWNPAEPGRGYAMERQGTPIIMGAYLYESSGTPTWYLATLNQQPNGSFTGPLVRYAGGQTLLGAYVPPSSAVVIAQATLEFFTPAAGALSLSPKDATIPARVISIERFSFSNPAFSPPAGSVDGGLWWNAAQGGRGYFVEVQGTQIFIGSFMYDESRQPTWYATIATLQNGQTASAALQQFTGGQSLFGDYKAANAQATNPGNVSLNALAASSSANAAIATLGLPDGSAVGLSRTTASVNGTPGVFSGFAGDIESVLADSGGGGGDGGGGSGGSAGAGGGLGKVLGGRLSVTDLSDGAFVGAALTDATNGMVSIKTLTRPGPFLLTMEGQAGATYYDEGLNQMVPFGLGILLHALVDKWDEHVGVSPLTEAAYRYVVNNFKVNPADIVAGRTPLLTTGNLTGLSSAQVIAANALIQNAVNGLLTTPNQLASAKSLPTPLDGSSGTSVLQVSNYGKSAAVNGGLVKAASFYNPLIVAPGLTFANDLARDFTDGRIDGFALDGTAVSPSDKVSFDSVRLPVSASIGVNTVKARFGATTLGAGPLTVDEEASVRIIGSSLDQTSGAVLCNAFRDDVALMSDGSVTVLRRAPTNTNGVCRFTNSAAETALVVKIKNFLTSVKFLSAGGPVAFAVKTDGTVVGWGENYCGRLSPALKNAIYTQPQLVTGLTDITAIRQAWAGNIARDKTGRIFTWGFNTTNTVVGQACASGYNSAGLQFIQYQDRAIVAYPALSNVANGYAKELNYYAVTTDGDVYGWGDGFAGLLANSDGTSSNGYLNGTAVAVPTKIGGLAGVRKLSFTELTAYSLHRDGSVMAWGNDNRLLIGNGLLTGSGRQTPTARPTAMTRLADIANLETDNTSARLQKTDGTVMVWGSSAAAATTSAPIVSPPTVVTTPEKVRYLDSRSSDYSVFFVSGKVVRDVTETTDVTLQFR